MKKQQIAIIAGITLSAFLLYHQYKKVEEDQQKPLIVESLPEDIISDSFSTFLNILDEKQAYEILDGLGAKRGTKMVGKTIANKILENKDVFYDSLEGKVLPKIEKDIEFILEKGWADSVERRDLNHCHILIPLRYPTDTEGYDKILSADDLIILYHSRELSNINTDRNILSTMNSSPIVINEKYTLSPMDIRCRSLCGISFELEEKKLSDEMSDCFAKIIPSGKYYFGIRSVK
jgi:hypothetical protein|tara:strand:+ start:79 stop:780 length:702 start_codon:yes stop_codon:yes gene_type:complete